MSAFHPFLPLAKGGRGTNAPRISPKEAAATLIAVAGSSKANEANSRLEKLEPLRSKSPGKVARTLLDAIISHLCFGSALDELLEIRVARTKRRATFHFRDGRVEEFLPVKPDERSDRFYVEGVLPAPLLQLVARAMVEHPDFSDPDNRSGRETNRPSGRDKSK